MSDKAPISLKSILVASKAVEAEFPGYPGFTVNLSFLSREALLNIRKKVTKKTMKGRQINEEIDEEQFLEEYTRAAIKGWSGLKFKYVSQLAPIEDSDIDGEDLLGYTEENALFLMKNSGTFDSWITETVGDLANFQKSSAKK